MYEALGRAEEMASYLERIRIRQQMFRTAMGPLRLAAFRTAGQVLALPRFGSPPTPLVAGSPQMPWLPLWPALRAKPEHSTLEFEWTHELKQAFTDIRAELWRVCESFERAKYDSEMNSKPWQTYYFFLNGRPISRNLETCPRTRAVLERIPHNGLHVCFSAIAPGGSLSPHTGPTNTSLTAHLGLANCRGSILHVANQKLAYEEGEVLIFDDTFVHWVENNGMHTRYTLMVTFWHPDLNRAERTFLRYLTSSLAE